MSHSVVVGLLCTERKRRKPFHCTFVRDPSSDNLTMVPETKDRRRAI
jgi:hypothetical protein